MRNRSSFLVAIVVPLLVACGGDSEDGSPGGSGGADAGIDTGGAAGQAGEAGQAGQAGQAGDAGSSGSSGSAGATQKEDRGDPAEFPTDCLETCQEACTQLETCGGPDSEYFPLDVTECVERCAIAMTSPYGIWEDVSGNFRCCASQDACFDVATCGGWLKHPSPGPSCEQLCDCMSQYMTVPPPPAGVTAPDGYRFADNVVVFEGSAVGPLPPMSAEVLWSGRHTALRFKQPVTAQQIERVAGGRRSLPTFYDAAGRVSAAVGDVFVKVSSAAQLKEVEAKAKAAGLGSLVKVPYGRDLYRVESTDAWKSLRALPSFAGLSGVRVELDMLRQYRKNFEPDDPQYAEQWHLQNTGQTEAMPGIDSRVSEAWDLTLGSTDVVIAINDDGVDINHPDLAGSCTDPLNFPADWEQKLGDPLAGFGSHGTSVAGVAAAIGDNGQGVAGVCPTCRIMPHMVGEAVGPAGLEMTDQEVADGFALMVDEGAWVINNSWGAGGGDPNFVTSTFPMPGTPQVVKDAFAYAETSGRGGLGTVVLFAAGNDNEPVAVYAKEPTVVTVAAVDDQGLKSYYSSYGPETDIAAPSNGGLNGIVTTAIQASYTDSFGGTSSATPFVSGVVGLILSANPNLTAAEVRGILSASATKIDPVWGQYDTDGHSDFYGAGLVNAYVAVRLALGDCTNAEDCPAPSDECGSACDKAACEPCRTTAQCADGHVCQALPPLGQSVCVAEEGTGCPAGTTAYEGYCIPDRQTCNLCTGPETCNGRDDDCNGAVDDGLDCTGKHVLECPLAGEGCAAAESCAATRCVQSCDSDADCGEDAACQLVKDRYGASDGTTKGCAASLMGSCKSGCEILAASMTDAEIEEFVSCMDDGNASCMSAFSCAQQLPIQM